MVDYPFWMQWNEFRSHIRHLTAKNQKRIEEAFRLGDHVHKGQTRKSGEPYFSHPVAVAEMLADLKADANTIIAAVLHDTIEDTPLTLAEIDRQFGGSVRSLIDGLTKLRAEDLPARPMLNEQTETLRKIFTLMEEDVRIMVIKLYDRLHNMQTAEFLPEERRRFLAQETLDVYVKIADRLCMQDLRDELEELCLSILEPDLYPQLLSLRLRNEQRGHQVAESMQAAIQKFQPALARRMTLQFEHKTWEQRRSQLEAGEASVTGLALVTCVFVCDDVDSCYQTLGALHQLWQREVLSFQDFINAPAINGYRGLHTTVILSDGTRVRCKMRTSEMQEYARKGVAMLCFQKKAAGVLQILPWTKHISSLSADTEGRSKEFWQSLQSDILGESITVHGPGDQTVQLPKGATVLDGAFYLFQDQALRLKTVKANGREVRFSTPLSNAASLDLTLSDEQTVAREWLSWVQTGFAAAHIRKALAQHSEEERVSLGREIFQQTMSEKGGGFIEEFDEASMQRQFRSLGYTSLYDIYLAIADGRVEPDHVFTALFRSSDHVTRDDRPSTIRYTVNMDDLAAMDRINQVHRRYGAHLEEIRYRRGTSAGKATVTLRSSLRGKAQQSLNSELSLAGAKDIHLVPPNILRFVLGVTCLTALWGLDPVFGRLLITTFALSPIDMVIVRFWSLSVMSGLLLLGVYLRNPLAQARLPLRNPSLWFSVALLFIIALATYTSLQTTPPSHYTIPMTAAGILLTSIVNRRRWRLLIITWTLLLCSTTVLVLFTPGWTLRGMIFTLLAVMSFSAFSIVSERYKKKERVDFRAAQYFFILSVSCAVLTLPLVAASHIALIPLPIVSLMILFSIFLAGLPYYMYYYLLSHREIDFILRYSFLIIPVTIAGQALFLEPVGGYAILAGGLVIVGAVLPLINFHQHTKHTHHQALQA